MSYQFQTGALAKVVTYLKEICNAKKRYVNNELTKNLLNNSMELVKPNYNYNFWTYKRKGSKPLSRYNTIFTGEAIPPSFK